MHEAYVREVLNPKAMANVDVSQLVPLEWE